jgi:spore germination cell wall hydrolase CwlJ-like protein
MTELTLDREQDTKVQVSSTLLKIITVLMMIVSVYGSVSLLQWAIANKQSNYQVTDSSQITTEVRERQLACLAKNIYYEAGNQPFEGKVAVAQVTINRTESGQYPSDICKTIYQKNIVYEKVLCQFSWVCDRTVATRAINKASFKESEEVAKKVLLEGFRLPSLKEAMYFHGDYINPGWKRERITKIGNHIFYK